jgi:hypothetical protein
MSDPSLFASPLVRQSARNLHRLEVLTANSLWTDIYRREDFWRAWRVMALTPDEATAWLPALAFAVSRERNAFVLSEFAWWPLPEPLPPEAIPWRNRLIRNWEQRPVPTEEEKSIRLFALVRLDRRAERLPEWLREARRARDLGWYDRHLRLGALAGWRPRPGDGPPHGDKAEAAQAWVRFWEKLYQHPDSQPDGLIAAAALLHLAEAGWLPSGPSPGRLRAEFRQRVQQVQHWTTFDPAWIKREASWRMLAALQREGILERCRISLAPDLARALKWERDSEVLRAMAGYIPGAAELSAHPKAARAVVARWEALSRSDNWRIRLAAWVGRWNLLRAGVLTTEEQGRFGSDYVDVVKFEPEVTPLLALARITPPGTFPLATWAGRLSDQDDRCRLAARLAIHGWLVEMAGGSEASGEWRVEVHYSLLALTRRQMRQVLRRAGQEGTNAGTVASFVNLPPEVLPDFRRLREIETALAAGQMPPPPDAGKGKQKRMGHLATPARLPKVRLRTKPPGITGRTAGSESTTRHPFSEPVRHE